MFARLARGAFLLLLAGMIAAYAFSATKSSAPEPQTDQAAERMYS